MQGEAYRRVDAVAPRSPAVPEGAPAALVLPVPVVPPRVDAPVSAAR